MASLGKCGQIVLGVTVFVHIPEYYIHLQIPIVVPVIFVVVYK